MKCGIFHCRYWGQRHRKFLEIKIPQLSMVTKVCIPALRRLRQKDGKLEASLACIMRSCLEKQPSVQISCLWVIFGRVYLENYVV
jgi:hypothetical protein